MDGRWSRRGILTAVAGLGGCSALDDGEHAATAEQRGDHGITRRWATRLTAPNVRDPVIDPTARLLYIVTSTDGSGLPERDDYSVVNAFRLSDGSIAWRFATEAPTDGPLVLGDDHIYLITGYSNGYRGIDQRVVALGRDGTRHWRSEPWSRFLRFAHKTPTDPLLVETHDDQIGSESGERLIAFGPDGQQWWKRETGNLITGNRYGDTVLYEDTSDNVIGVDAESGREKWRTNDMWQWFDTDVDDRYWYTFEDETFAARSPDENIVQWRYDGPEGTTIKNIQAVPRQTDETASSVQFVGNSADNTLFALDNTGTEVWTHSPPDEQAYGAPSSERVYVVSDGMITVLSLSHGRTLRQFSYPDGANIDVLRSGVRMSKDQTYAEFAPDGTERWSFTPADRNGIRFLTEDLGYVFNDGLIELIALDTE